MILAQDIRNQLAFALDAEGSDHYRDDTDYIPAINASLRWFVNVVNSALGQNKIGEEFFRHISYSGVFQTDNNSRLTLKVFPKDVWAILAVYIEPKTQLNRNVPFQDVDDLTRSYCRNNLVFVDADKGCKRLTVEEWIKAKPNPFEAGFNGDAICNQLKEYAYLNPINHWNSSTNNTHSEEIEIRPALVNKLIAVVWAKKPTEITSLSDNIEFPTSSFQMLFEKALNYISYKQGDGTNIYTVSDRDINQLISLMQ